MTGFLEVLAVVLLAGNVAVALERRRARIHAAWALEDAEAGWPAQLLLAPPPELRADYAPRHEAAMTYQAHRAEASAAWPATWAPQAGNIRDDLERARLLAAGGSYELTEYVCPYCPTTARGDFAYWWHIRDEHPDVAASLVQSLDPDGGRRGD